MPALQRYLLPDNDCGKARSFFVFDRDGKHHMSALRVALLVREKVLKARITSLPKAQYVLSLISQDAVLLEGLRINAKAPTRLQGMPFPLVLRPIGVKQHHEKIFCSSGKIEAEGRSD